MSDLLIDTGKVSLHVKPLTGDKRLFIQVCNHSINLKTFATLDLPQLEALVDYLAKQLIKTKL